MNGQQLLQVIWQSAPYHQQPCVIKFDPPLARQRQFEETAPSLDQLPLNQALRVKNAEYWLKLGKPDRAIGELRRLSDDSRRHPLALRIHLRAIRAVREMNEVALQA